VAYIEFKEVKKNKYFLKNIFQRFGPYKR